MKESEGGGELCRDNQQSPNESLKAEISENYAIEVEKTGTYQPTFRIPHPAPFAAAIAASSASAFDLGPDMADVCATWAFERIVGGPT